MSYHHLPAPPPSPTINQPQLFHNLSILAWATVIAKGVELLAPWEEKSPVFKFIGENVSHQAADMVLEGQELLINLMK